MFDRNDIKVSFVKEKYETRGNEIRCTLKYVIKVPEFFRSTHDTTVGAVFDLGTHTATGVAICNDRDEFNKQLGRDIANVRAEAKAYRDAQRLVKKYVEVAARGYYEIVQAFDAKADYIQRHDAEYLAELVR